MKIELRFCGVEGSDALREYMLRRVHFQLTRFAHELDTVVVRMSDINGPKGGIDKRCKVTVRGPRIGSLTLAELTGDAYSALDLAIGRISRAVSRDVARTRAAHGARTSMRGAS